MAMVTVYPDAEPSRAEVEALKGPTLLEFGTNWCGHCRRAQPHIAAALLAHPQVRHIKVGDASGKRLGRGYQVKLWPTLVFLSDGEERARLVRPQDEAELERAMQRIDPR